MFVVFIYLCMGVIGYRVLSDISFLSFYCLYGWCAMHNGFMHMVAIAMQPAFNNGPSS